jgi:hypothetical protein
MTSEDAFVDPPPDITPLRVPDAADIAWETLSETERAALIAWVDRRSSLPNLTEQYIGWGKPLVRDVAKAAGVEALARANETLAEIDRAERAAPTGVLLLDPERGPVPLDMARFARDRRRRLLRLRIEPTNPVFGPLWLVNLATIGWLAGVVDCEWFPAETVA